MKSANPKRLEDQGESWNLSWSPDGRSEKFTREAIVSGAPAASGIYGLFNFDCQIFIGESDDIQEVLLRIESQVDFWSEHLRPKGFTFELCDGESRRQKTSELIARYRPVLQTIAEANETPAPGKEIVETALEQSKPVVEASVDPGRKPFLQKHALFAALLAIVLGICAAAYYVPLPFDLTFSGNREPSDNGSPADRAPEVYAREAALHPQRMEITSKKESRQQPAADEEPIVWQANGAMRVARASVSHAAGAEEPSVKGEANRTSGGARKTWSVQISASPEKDVADRLAQQLIAKGYDAYVAQAEVKGHTYYRVRTGRFETREDADSLRRTLIRQNNSADAFITSD